MRRALFRVGSVVSCAALGACASLLGDEPMEPVPSDPGVVPDAAAPNDAAAVEDDAASSSGEPPMPDAGAPTIPAKDVVAGRAHTCVIAVSGKVLCWGANEVGQLGNGSRQFSRTPVEVVEAAGATHLAAGADFTCARLPDARVVCWGADARGQLGDGTYATQGRTRPVLVQGVTEVLDLAAGANHACARTATGVFCWGNNSRGQCGLYAPEYPSVPIAHRLDLEARALSLGEQHSCALDAAGTVSCWGANEFHQLGRAPGTPEDYRPVAVPSLGAGGLLAAQHLGNCIVPTSNPSSVACWGDGREAKLGFATEEIRNFTRPLDISSPATALASGAGHTCALHGGEVSCLGANTSGQLGQGHSNVLEGMLPVSLPRAARAIGLGQLHSCAVTEDGAVYCWGSNSGGRLGTGDGAADVLSPRPVLAFGPDR